MSKITQFVDGFQNLVANLGTDRDKAAANSYVDRGLSYSEIVAAYRVSSLAKKLVNRPAEDAFREWREWQADAEQISKIEAEEKRLGVKQKLMEVRKAARLFGGAALFIGTGETDLRSPLDPARISAGGIKYLTVLGKMDLTEGQRQLDPREDHFGNPAYFSMSSGIAAAIDIHPSRLVVFRGERLPGEAAREPDTWGDSVLNTVLQKISMLDGTMANIASLVFEAKVDVIKIKGLTENLRDGGEAYERLMLKRFSLAATAKGINGAMLLDSSEEYDQKSANFSNLPDVADKFMDIVCEAADMPRTVLFGTSPGGLNASGNGETRGYYDMVKAKQANENEPAMAVLDECLIGSALGNRPEEIHYNWRPLWMPTAKERAETGKILSETMKAAVEFNGVSTEAAGKALVNALTETGAFPGLEAAVGEFPSEEPDGTDEENASTLRKSVS